MSENPTKSSVKAAQRQKRYRDAFPNGCLTCIDCKSKYDKIRVIESAWRRIGMFNCLCDLCA